MNSPPITCQSARVLSCMLVKLALAFIVSSPLFVRGVAVTVDLHLTLNCQEFDNAGCW